MADTKKHESKILPEHLDPFCEPTPGSVTKFLAAWDGLSLETILLLFEKRYRNRYESDELYKKAFQSDNPYLRYIGYKYTREKDELKEQAYNDPHPLVRGAVYEARGSFLNKEIYEPEQFFNLPQEIRMAIVRGYVAETDLNSQTGADSHYCLVSFQKNVTEIVKYALKQSLPKQTISEAELCDLLKEIFSAPTKTSFHTNGSIEFSTLWKMVSVAPDHIAILLLRHLPAQGAAALTEDDIQVMRAWQVETLFSRSDIQLSELREKCELQTNKNR